MLRVTTLAERRAAAGAAYLDQIHPGWENQINPHRLDLDSANQCVIGQLYGDFYDWITQMSQAKIVQLGFWPSPRARSKDLTTAWGVEIDNRCRPRRTRHVARHHGR